jgi:hypothetical protein
VINDRLIGFIAESNAIEGIIRPPTWAEITAVGGFLEGPLSMPVLCDLQAVFAPGCPIRSEPGMDVRVGQHIPPGGGPDIPVLLRSLLGAVIEGGNEHVAYQIHCAFQSLHPFTDGNGRTGRALWAWHMKAIGADPFEMPFLQRWYYQSLAAWDQSQ